MSQLSLDRQQRHIYEDYARLSIPRHTSYPPAPFWQQRLTWREQLHQLQDFGQNGHDLSLYFHIPFCESLCYYCGCSKVIRPKSDRSAGRRLQEFLTLMHREIELKSQALQGSRVQHIHFGGGTPTYLDKQHWQDLWQRIKQSFSITETAEIAIEVDPRSIKPGMLAFLRELGFNRLSLGIQDFDETVQQAINRLQSYESVAALMQDARKLGFDSINFDLIYGLPFQSPESLQSTLQKVIQLSPDRIAFYRLAVIPHLFKWQRQFQRKDLPTGQASLDLFLQAIQVLGEADYEFIGLDHFAKPSDRLSLAAKSRQLGRNFQGMTDQRDQAIIAFGPTGISQFDRFYIQNPHDIRDYAALMNSQTLDLKSYQLNDDDLIRRNIIQDIYCYGHVDLQSIAETWTIDWQSYFAASIRELQSLQEDGLVEMHGSKINEQAQLGRLLRRVIATAFDQQVSLLEIKQGAASYCGSTAG